VIKSIFAFSISARNHESEIMYESDKHSIDLVLSLSRTRARNQQCHLTEDISLQASSVLVFDEPQSGQCHKKTWKAGDERTIPSTKIKKLCLQLPRSLSPVELLQTSIILHVLCTPMFLPSGVRDGIGGHEKENRMPEEAGAK
jgi:hypothetical protein